MEGEILKKQKSFPQTSMKNLFLIPILMLQKLENLQRHGGLWN
jgi:hypothetical protein